MKKFMVLFLSVFLLYSNSYSPSVTASEDKKRFEFSEKSEQNQQFFGYYILDFYNKEIFDAMRKQYEGQTIVGYNIPTWMKYNVVSITPIWQSNKNSQKPKLVDYSYAIKITLIPTTNNGATMLGTDTIYFKVEPGRFHMKNVPEHLPPVKLVKYVHNPPPSPKTLSHLKKEIKQKQPEQ
jgi:hypothetical protein